MRNLEKDAKEMAERRKKMLDIGFRLFSERTIESVSMQQIADEACLGLATVYRYFPRKQEFVVTVGSEQWRVLQHEFSELIRKTHILEKSFYEQFSFFFDCIIFVYEHHRDFLRFNYDFNRYVQSAEIDRDIMTGHIGALISFRTAFDRLYREGVSSGRLRADVSSDDMFSAIVHLMFAAATRYAVGVIYHTAQSSDLEELKLLKNMLIREFTV